MKLITKKIQNLIKHIHEAQDALLVLHIGEKLHKSASCWKNNWKMFKVTYNSAYMHARAHTLAFDYSSIICIVMHK